MKLQLTRLRFDLRMQAARRPVVWRLVPAVNWLRVRDSHALVNRRTELVIDGFPSSGNSFSAAALRYVAGDHPVAVAHHLHCPGQVRWAVRHDVPVLLLARDPGDAVVSLACRWPLTVEQGLRGYVGYYRSLLPVADRTVVARFREVVTDFGAVTDRVNQRYGTSFPRFEHTPEHVKVLYDPTDAKHDQRRAQAARIRPELDDPRLGPLLAEARAVHERYEQLAVEQAGARP